MRSWVRRVALLGALLSGLPALGAGYERRPKKEEMLLNDHPVVVDYQISASSDDLLLPFYPGARLENGFCYTVTMKDGTPVLYYALADLATPHPPKRVAEHYQSKLAGNPRPEEISDNQGRRLVLAVGVGDEVRMVTITARPGGSRIQLVRATKPAIPEARPRPPMPQPRPPRGPARGGRRGMRADSLDRAGSVC